jgi:replication factor A1
MLRRSDQLEVKVKDLKPNLRWFTITVKILKLNDEKIVFSKKDGDQHRLAEALVGDETGTILMSLWDEDIDKVRDLVGSTVKIKNGFVTLYKGSMRLSLGRFGTLEKIDEDIIVNESINFSEKFYGRNETFGYKRSF